MASFSQNLVRFEHDGDFNLIFTVTNAGTTLGASNYCAVWLLLNNETVASSTSILKQAHTNPSTVNYLTTVSTSDCSASGVTDLDGVTSNLGITVGNTTVQVDWTYAHFSAINPGSYYHELTLLDRSSSNCYQCRSQVVASGVLTVNESLFTNRPYR